MAVLDYDAIIVGAGLSGLVATQQLNLAGHSTILLEASSKVGGCIANVELAGLSIEMGLTTLQSDHHQLIRFLDDHHITPLSQPRQHMVCEKPWTSYLNAGNYWYRRDIHHFERKMNSKLGELNCDTPWEHPSAGLLDHQTFLDFIDQNTSWRKSRQALVEYFQAELGYDLSAVSALDVLHHLKVHNFSFQSTKPDSDLFLPIGSLHNLFRRMAYDLNIKLRHPVHEIDQHKNFVRVEGAFFSYTAKRVILAIPAPCAKSIEFNSTIPASTKSLWQKVFTGELFRMASLIESTHLPNSNQLNEVNLDPFHNMSIIDLGEDQSLMVLEARGNSAIKLSRLKQGERSEIFTNLYRQLGIEESNSLPFVVKFWNDDFWSCGRHLYRPLGSLTAHQNLLAKPQGRILFAGATTSIRHRGTMEGAVQSGLRAAQEALMLSPTFHM